jgi:hypothetical protein
MNLSLPLPQTAASTGGGVMITIFGGFWKFVCKN